MPPAARVPARRRPAHADRPAAYFFFMHSPVHTL